MFTDQLITLFRVQQIRPLRHRQAVEVIQHGLVVGYNITTWYAGVVRGVVFSPRIAVGWIGVAKMHAFCLQLFSTILF